MSFLEINKIVGAILATALVTFLISIAGNVLVPEDSVESAERPPAAATTAATTGKAGGAAPSAGTTKPKPAETPLANLLAQGSAEAGKKVAKKCAACHNVDKGGPNKIGPNLYGIVGRKKGSHPGYSYSDAMKNAGGAWTYADLNAFLTKTTAFVKGTKMRLRISKPSSRANLLLYLRTLSDSPAPLPKPAPASNGGAEKKAEAVKKTTAEKVPAEAPKPSATPKPAETPKKTAAPQATAAAALAAGDATRGAKLAKRKCAVCHSLTKGGPNKIGPNLYGVIGRARASYEGYRYSQAMKAKGGTWSAADIFTFLAGPQKFVKGTNMPIKVRKPAQRADIIAYLRTLGGK